MQFTWTCVADTLVSSQLSLVYIGHKLQNNCLGWKFMEVFQLSKLFVIFKSKNDAIIHLSYH